jgi:nucleoside-diphosphate-sugar epimerase
VILAMTGATGFVGRRTLDHAVERGHQVRALTRRPQPPRDGVTWVAGSLDRPGALAEGADAMLHIAGVVNAPDRAGFAAGNIEGTRSIAAAAERAGVRRFVHVSSLSAREPGLSNYGWSKAEGESVVRASSLHWNLIRPPAVYGPGDMELLDVFRIARLRLVPTPPPGGIAVIHVDDLARLLVVSAEAGASGQLFEADDGRDDWNNRAFAAAIAQAAGYTALPVSIPAPLLRLAARLDRALRGPGAKLTLDRARYLSHRDWRVTPELRPPAALWQPQVVTADGLAATARWYRDHGLL